MTITHYIYLYLIIGFIVAAALELVTPTPAHYRLWPRYQRILVPVLGFIVLNLGWPVFILARLLIALGK